MIIYTYNYIYIYIIVYIMAWELLGNVSKCWKRPSLRTISFLCQSRLEVPWLTTRLVLI